MTVSTTGAAEARFQIMDAAPSTRRRTTPVTIQRNDQRDERDSVSRPVSPPRWILRLFNSGCTGCSYICLSATRICFRAALKAGRKPPSAPMISANARPLMTTLGVMAS